MRHLFQAVDVAALISTLSFFPVPPLAAQAHAEYLIKGRARYLGYQVSNVAFRTCEGDSVVVGDGKVVPAEHSCPSSGGITPTVVNVSGTVVSFDAAARMFEIRDSAGNNRSFFVPAAVRENDFKLGELPAGQSVTVAADFLGRAESVCLPTKVGPKRCNV